MIVFGSMILFITGDERYVLGSLGSVTLGSILMLLGLFSTILFNLERSNFVVEALLDVL